MTMMANVGWGFKTPGADEVSASIILPSSVNALDLLRRHETGLDRWPNLDNRLLDPQFYYLDLNPHASSGTCAKLLTYPWFLPERAPVRKKHRDDPKALIRELSTKADSYWPTEIPNTKSDINRLTLSCLKFQDAIGCFAYIAPTPLLFDSADSLELYANYLDASLDALANRNVTHRPIFATIALSDLCLRHRPYDSDLLVSLADLVSARGFDGAYLILEQASEPAEGRHCASTRPVESMLALSSLLGNEAELEVIVNFAGAFGLACIGAGASYWATGWYKSQYRFRLADSLAAGRAMPTYWAHQLAADIHLKSDLDRLAKHPKLWQELCDRTDASLQLLHRLEKGGSVKEVGEWEYRKSNVAAAKEHYMLSALRETKKLSSLPPHERIISVQRWLTTASELADRVIRVVGPQGKTRINHVGSWLEAVENYLSSQ